jgi:hypothetical protein
LSTKTFEGPTWLYGPGNEARLFEKGEEHPGKGWNDEPDPSIPPPPPAGSVTAAEVGQSVAEQLAERDAEIEAANAKFAASEERRAELEKTVADLETQLATVTAERDALKATADAGKPGK